MSLGVNEKSPVVHLEKDSLKLAAPAQKIPVDLSSPLCVGVAEKGHSFGSV